MPTYDYKCKKCGRTFTEIMTIAAHEKAKVKCPKCGTRSVGQLLSACLVKTSKKLNSRVT